MLEAAVERVKGKIQHTGFRSAREPKIWGLSTVDDLVGFLAVDIVQTCDVV